MNDFNLCLISEPFLREKVLQTFSPRPTLTQFSTTLFPRSGTLQKAENRLSHRQGCAMQAVLFTYWRENFALQVCAATLTPPGVEAGSVFAAAPYKKQLGSYRF